MATATLTLDHDPLAVYSPEVDILNHLLRGELSAVHTYDQAITSFDEATGDAAAVTLAQIRDEHDRAVGRLRERVRLAGGTPSEGAGLWGAFASAVTGAAKLIGRQTVLAALRQGERHGIDDYEHRLTDPTTPFGCQELIRDDLLPWCRDHALALGTLLEQPDPAGQV